MVRAVGRGFVAARNRLPVVIAEAACHARSKPGVVKRAKEAIESGFEASIHASDHVVLRRHAGFLCGLRILPCEIFIHELGNGFYNGPCLPLGLGRHFDPFLHLDGIHLGRAFVHQPEILIDAVLSQHTLIRSFERSHIDLWLGECNLFDRTGVPHIRIKTRGTQI